MPIEDAAAVKAAFLSGKIDEAKALAEARVAAAPSDWIARYNLGLAEAQLGNAGLLVQADAVQVLELSDCDVV